MNQTEIAFGHFENLNVQKKLLPIWSDLAFAPLWREHGFKRSTAP